MIAKNNLLINIAIIHVEVFSGFNTVATVNMYTTSGND